MINQIKITVIATGFDETKRRLREMTTKPARDVRYGMPQQPQGSMFRQTPSQSGSTVQPIPDPAAHNASIFTPTVDDVPPEEDEFDIPAFLRQRS